MRPCVTVTVGITKTLHIISHTRLTLTTLPWKRHRFFLGSPLLLTEFWTTTKSDRPIKQVWIIPSCLGSQCAYRYSPDYTTYADVFTEMFSVHYRNLTKIVRAICEKLAIFCKGLIWPVLIFGPRMFISAGHRPMTDESYIQNISKSVELFRR
jgi:hypothetical protein